MALAFPFGTICLCLRWEQDRRFIQDFWVVCLDGSLACHKVIVNVVSYRLADAAFHFSRGRFAPTPSGPLHFGSLVAAVSSFLHARSRGGEWFVRLEDVDRSRVVPGAADAILRLLEDYGLEWDGPVMVQSERGDVYRAALDALIATGAVYSCGCSRKEIADSHYNGRRESVYPGTCREGLPPGRVSRSLRVRTAGVMVAFDDLLQGRICQTLDADVGDFVVSRSDQSFTYHLAMVVDDAAQGITDVVRGADLLGSTPRQIHLQRLLGLSTPTYAHVPVAVNARGEKLSKQAHAEALTGHRPAAMLWAALQFLRQAPPDEIARADVAAVWQWALANWRLDAVAGIVTATAP